MNWRFAFTMMLTMLGLMVCFYISVKLGDYVNARLGGDAAILTFCTFWIVALSLLAGYFKRRH